MLSVFQTRAIHWDREASELDDTQMNAVENLMLNLPILWTELEIGKIETQSVEHDGRR